MLRTIVRNSKQQDNKMKTMQDNDSFSKFLNQLNNRDDTDLPKFVCCLCNQDSRGYGNNPIPLKSSGRCCDKCNNKVIGARWAAQMEYEKTH